MTVNGSYTTFDSNKPTNRTLAYQDELPKLPIPPLSDTLKRYLRALEALQDEKDHAVTQAAVQEFLETDGPKLDELLREYAKDKARCASFAIGSVWIGPYQILQLYRGVLVRVVSFTQRPRRPCSEPVLRA